MSSIPKEHLDRIHPELAAGLLELESSMIRLVDVREKTAGREISDPESYAQLAVLAARLGPLARMHKMFGEERACAIFDWRLEFESMPDWFPTDVEQKRKEMRFKTGRKVDRAVFHNSGRLSIIEIKDACDQRAVVAGIGQALLYSSLAEKEYPDRQIVPCLAVLGESDPDVARACQRGGVEYIPLGAVSLMVAYSHIAAMIVGDYGRS